MVDDYTLWQGQSGANYRYWIYNLPPNFEAVGGNYVFIKRTSAKNFKPIYFGEADDLSDQILQRLSAQCVQQYGATHIHVHSTPGGITIRGYEESDLISNYDPPFNRIQGENLGRECGCDPNPYGVTSNSSRSQQILDFKTPLSKRDSEQKL